MGETGERREAEVVVTLWRMMQVNPHTGETALHTHTSNSPVYLPHRLTITVSVCFSRSDEVCLDLFDRECD